MTIRFDENTDELVFPSGAREYAFSNTLGIDEKGRLSYGYDGNFDTYALSPADKVELADMMIQRWTEYRARLSRAK